MSEPKPLSLERRQEIQENVDYDGLDLEWWAENRNKDVADLLREVERLEEEVRQARGNRQ